MDCSPSPEGEEVVMDTSQVVVGTSQEGEEAVDVPADPTVLGGEESGVDPTLCCRNYWKTSSCLD